MISITEIPEQKWLEAWKNGYKTTYFQSPEWFKLWEKLTHGSVSTAFSVTNQEGRELGILPVFSVAKFGIKQHHSSCASTYGGLIQSEDQQHHLTPEQITEIGSHFNNLIWRIPPESAPKQIDSEPDFGLKYDFTHRLDLSQGLDPIEKYWNKGKFGITKKIQEAKEAGVSVFPAKYPEEWDEYHELYIKNTKEWDPPPSTVYSSRFFNELSKSDAGYIKLWLAVSSDDQIIAGAVCLYSGSNCVYWHGASSKEHYQSRPVHLLISAIVRDAIQQKLNFFDFNPSGGVKGVERFKTSFGAEKYVSPVFNNRSGVLDKATGLRSFLKKFSRF